MFKLIIIGGVDLDRGDIIYAAGNVLWVESVTPNDDNTFTVVTFDGPAVTSTHFTLAKHI